MTTPRNVPDCRQKRSVPNCHIKRKGADLLVAPLKLNVRLSKCGPRSVEPLRRLVKRRNLHPLRDLVDEVVGLFPAQARVGDGLAKDAAVDRLVAVFQVGLDHKALDQLGD